MPLLGAMSELVAAGRHVLCNYGGSGGGGVACPLGVDAFLLSQGAVRYHGMLLRLIGRLAVDAGGE